MNDDFIKAMETTFRDSVKMKKKMLARNVIAASAPCPECEGKVHGRLVGPRKHLHFWCDGPCNRRMME